MTRLIFVKYVLYILFSIWCRQDAVFVFVYFCFEHGFYSARGGRSGDISSSEAEDGLKRECR